MLAGPFDRPIPGQSLVTEPRNNPWEQPPQIADKDDALKYYIAGLENKGVKMIFELSRKVGYL